MGPVSKRRIAYALAWLAAAAYVYQKRDAFFQMLTVFLFAVAFTLILSPLCRTLERRGLRTPLAAACCVLCFVLAAGLILAAFVPYPVSYTHLKDTGRGRNRTKDSDGWIG